MKKILLGILVLLILIQFVRPDKNRSEALDLISLELNVPKEIENIILTSCSDCHTDHTVYPWYAELAPMSWYLASHINNGREHLNFTQWSNYNKDQKLHIIKDLEEELSNQKMPLKSYLILHENAKLDTAQYEQLLAWVATLKIEYNEN